MVKYIFALLERKVTKICVLFINIFMKIYLITIRFHRKKAKNKNQIGIN